MSLSNKNLFQKEAAKQLNRNLNFYFKKKRTLIKYLARTILVRYEKLQKPSTQDISATNRNRVTTDTSASTSLDKLQGPPINSDLIEMVCTSSWSSFLLYLSYDRKQSSKRKRCDHARLLSLKAQDMTDARYKMQIIYLKGYGRVSTK